MDNQPTYKINGLERRKVKKKLAELKSFVKDFWHYHNLDKDMYSFYSTDNIGLMPDSDAKLLYDSKINEIEKITKELEEPYKSIADIRNEKIESIVEDKKPDLVVFTKDIGYDAKFKPYPTNVSAPAFTVPDVSLFRTESSKKMIAAFERERQEIVERIEKLQDEYTMSMMVWESKISFEPIVGKPYHLYNFDGENTLSLIAPNEWSKGEFYIGTFLLNSDNKWIKS